MRRNVLYEEIELFYAKELRALVKEFKKINV